MGMLGQAQQIDFVDVERDRCFQVVAKIKVDDRNLSKLSLKEGLAVAYDGSTKSKD